MTSTPSTAAAPLSAPALKDQRSADGHDRPSKTPTARRIGCVSFLNAKPLIEGLEDGEDPHVTFDVPSGLLAGLEDGQVDAALCPVIDFQRSSTPLVIVPAGGIGCRGTTLTVRLFSQSPLNELTEIYVDTDSHTSVALLRVLLAERFGITPRLIDFHAPSQTDNGSPKAGWPQAMLLIGDKVVTGSPPSVRYPHQMDLGHAWHEMTGLPFVFAVWMAREGEPLGDLPATLSATREKNMNRLDALVARHAAAHGWPEDLAAQYLGHWLRYEITPDALTAIERFYNLAHDHGLIESLRPMRVLG